MLSDLACRKAKVADKMRKLSDMQGLQLWIFPNGSKLWRFAYRHAGKQKLLSLGRYPDVPILAARAARDKLRLELAEGSDPSRTRKRERFEKSHPDDLFETVAREYLAKLEREGCRASTLKKNRWLADLAKDLWPLSVKDIRPLDVLGVVRKVEKRGRYHTALRLCSFIGGIFRYAIATGRTERDPSHGLSDALTKPKVKHRAAITDPQKVGGLLRAIDGYAGHTTTRLGLKLEALMFPRPIELRMAKWVEFDLAQRVWKIPAARMKKDRDHHVYLATQSVALLLELKELTGRGVGGFILPSVKSVLRPMSENTLNGALRLLGYAEDEMTAHGFRTTASTLLNESNLWKEDAIERQLSHVEEDETRAAYNRGEYWDERVKMMQWWADYLDQLRQQH